MLQNEQINLYVNSAKAGRITDGDNNLTKPFFTKAQARQINANLFQSGKFDRRTYLRIKTQIEESQLDGVPPYIPQKGTSGMPKS